MASVIRAWNAVIAQSKQLVSLAEQGQWEEVEALLSERTRQIDQLTGGDVAPGQADAVRGFIAQIQQADKALETLAQARRKEALDGLRNAGNAGKMKAAYSRTKRGF